MAVVVIATWTARPGTEPDVRRALEDLAVETRAEPGCRFYQPTQDRHDPRSFVLLEIYEDDAAYEAHASSEHFRRHALERGIPLLEHRERRFLDTL